ncbi:S-layer homology domain-containing protein [Paenibacillus athensensis]|uniref:Uncharacterized protein n=1 Tax=Paenibacillus athensensis TaxID=1967502 RepID=A0A4Y8PXE5_9BACL|nr:S-layer homology domain-containing protein [Paenibacillus athensensis]MCD1259884.1 S-layer homology domain-containing protein [Paenibacillus athensensis]
MLKKSVSGILAWMLIIGLFAVEPGPVVSASGSGGQASVSTDVYAADATAVSVDLAWADVPGAECFNVYRASGSGGPYVKVNGSAVASSRFTDSGLSANTRYYYKVAALNGGTESAAVEGSALTQPDFGPNVYVFDPSTPAADIQQVSDQLFAQQETNQFGSQRYAMLFKPGTYSTNIRLGFYTQVAGLGMLPDDVTFNGGVAVDANWLPPHNATQNFWRSIENFAEVPTSGNMLWAVSQAASMRRIHVKGGLTLHDQGGWASGGYLADSIVDGTVVPGSQQQWFSRNSQWGSWNGSVWNTTLLGSVNPPAENYPTNAYTVIDRTPVIREKPFLIFDGAAKQYRVFVPDMQTNTNGASWAGGAPAGTLLSLEDFFVAYPSTPVSTINAALSQGKHLMLTPGVYHISQPIQVTNPDTVVLGLGLATLHVDNGNAALQVADVDGVKIAGLLFEAGAVNSPVLLQIGAKGSSASHAANPTSLQDLYFRVGGDALALADVCVEINSNNVIGDHFWVWRADHGTGAGWNSNLTVNGVVVNGNDVTFYGLFVEHFHEYQTVWNGERGKMYFYQTEIPYDVPDQESWMSANGTVNGYASYKVADTVTQHEAYGLGLYSFFRDAEVKLDHAIEIPDVPGVKIHHATTVFLNGYGEITHIANATGTAVKKGTMRTTMTDYVPRTTASIQGVSATTLSGTAPVLPDSVTQTFTDGTSKLAHVVWDAISGSAYAAPGSFSVDGTVDGSPIRAQASVTVVQRPAVTVGAIAVSGAGGAAAIAVKGGTLQMIADVQPANADNRTVNWSVTDLYGLPTDKATISADGLLTAVKDGKVRVVAVAGDYSGVKGEATITISGQITKTRSITVSGAGQASVIAVKSGTLQMSADVKPTDADDPSVTWSVVNTDGSATDKAAISAAGLLTAKKDGDVKVVATANDGSGVTGSRTISIVGQSTILGTGWSWIRESKADWSLDAADGSIMKLRTIEGSWGGSKPSNILLRDPGTTGDIAITTKLKFAASTNFEWAGLIVYTDDGNLISLGRSAVNQIRFSQVKNGTQTDKNYADPTVPGDIYLKIGRVGTVYSGYYSTDGTTWTKVTDTFNITLANTKVGIFTRKLNTAIPQKIGEFSNFTLNGTAIPYWNPVASINVTGDSGATAITTRGGTLQMAAEVLPIAADNKTVVWSVIGGGAATISPSGLLSASGNGTATVVATASDGSGVTGSLTITITGNAAMPSIDTQPADRTVQQGDSSPTLVVAATASDGGALSYQWYSKELAGNSGGTPISGATGASYAAPTNVVGTTYYYAIVTNGSGSDVQSVATSAAKVTVNALIRFESNGGTAVDNQAVAAGGTIAPPVSPTKPGYTFAGWYDDSGLTHAFDFDTVVSDSLQLYAKWASSMNLLADLSADQISIAPAFSASVFDYTVNVDHSVTSLDLLFTKGDSLQTLAVTGATLHNATGNVEAYTASNLSLGSNLITVVLTAENGATNTYTVTINRGLSSNADLSGLTLAGVTLNPAFAAATTAYQAKAVNTVSRTAVTATAADPNATLTVNGLAVTSGQPSGLIALNVGTTKITVVVTAQDGTVKTYSVAVTRAASGQDAGGATPGTPGSGTGSANEPTAPGGPDAPTDPVTTEPVNPGSGSEPQAPAVHPFRSSAVNGEDVVRVVKNAIARAQDVNVSFTDTSGHWGQPDVTKAVKLSIVEGYPDGSFHPDEAVTRAEFATMVYHAFGLEKTTTSAAFGDTATHWASGYISALAAVGILNGYDDGSFRPDATISRAEMVTIFARILNMELMAEGTAGGFADVDNAYWAKDAIQQALAAKLVEGVTATTFAPQQSATRAEAVTLLLRALQSDSSVKELLAGLE